ncbi:MAG: MBG domain-containing protein [Prevotella sp.]|nr:MBG domain-containing protein [Prevotella sp.]
MKLNKKTLILFVTTLMMATNALAGGTVNIIKMLNGTENNSVGTVTSQVNQENGQCVITVTPATSYYIGVITAEKTVSGDVAQARRAPGFDNMLTVTATDAAADPSGVTTWTFTMPDEDYDVEVIANFQQCTDISTAVVTIAATSFDYDGEAKEPAITSVMLGQEAVAATNYDVVYGDNDQNNIDAGTVTVYVTGKNTYTGTATATFTINKIALSNLAVAVEDWVYGQYNSEVNAPRIIGNLGQGAVTYTYKAEGATEFTTTVPENAGTHTVKAVVAETTNYQSGEATSTFTVAKADITPTVNLQGWTYGDAANAPSVNGNTGNGTVAYAYAVFADTPDYSATVPSAAGRYIVKATIDATANYNGAEVTTEFSIAKADFSQVVIADIADQTFTGNSIKPAITVTFKSNPVDASEYIVTYDEDINVGQATVTLTTKGVNFTAGDTNPSKTFQILPAQVVVTAEEQVEIYNGNPQLFTNYEGAANIAVLVHYYLTADDREAGENEIEVAQDAKTYYVQIVSDDVNYSFAPVNSTLVINPKMLTDGMVWTESDENIYNGQEQTLNPELYGADDEEIGAELHEGVDYNVTYTNNVNVGTATMTFTGIGNYQGTVTRMFNIVRELNIVLNEDRTWASYYAEENLEVPFGLKAYIVTGVADNQAVVNEIDYIPQNVGVLLTFDEVVPDVITAAAYEGAAQEFTNNLLQGTATAKAVTSITGGTVYVLFNNEFVKTTHGNIPANRAYLVLDAAVNGGESRSLSIVIDDETNGISEVVSTVQPNGLYYNLQGQRIAPSAKGLVIVNGKKVFVK